ncbi:hypothetical protein ILUMI_04938 [Ignelater luminosus]|uniref:Uncharacterized protein n=1 Tax=Ignelater luminosus TaxID=2038154 RepID=A0A8K0DCW8_IGNLU|nr:hypothetical protein ILUMI_04938 [Ignelater luminosus]
MPLRDRGGRYENFGRKTLKLYYVEWGGKEEVREREVVRVLVYSENSYFGMVLVYNNIGSKQKPYSDFVSSRVNGDDAFKKDDEVELKRWIELSNRILYRYDPDSMKTSTSGRYGVDKRVQKSLRDIISLICGNSSKAYPKLSGVPKIQARQYKPSGTSPNFSCIETSRDDFSKSVWYTTQDGLRTTVDIYCGRRDLKMGRIISFGIQNAKVTHCLGIKKSLSPP